MPTSNDIEAFCVIQAVFVAYLLVATAIRYLLREKPRGHNHSDQEPRSR